MKADTKEEPKPLYACPKCGGTDLDVAIRAWAKLYQEDGEITGTVPDESHDGEHHWEKTSSMFCNACEHQDAAYTFETENQVNAT